MTQGARLLRLTMLMIPLAILSIPFMACSSSPGPAAESPYLYTQEPVAPDASGDRRYDRFYSLGAGTAVIPGLLQDFVPQGLDVWAERGWVLISGYAAGGASLVFVVDSERGSLLKTLALEGPDGAPFRGHSGGIAVGERNAFIASDGALYRASLASIEASGPLGTLRLSERLETPTDASFCSYSGGVLWVGDFYYEKGYPAEAYKRSVNRDGEEHFAWIVGYKGEPSGERAVPDYVLSIKDRIQGMARLPGSYVALSESYGRRNDSALLFYRDPLASSPHGYAELGGALVPLWYLDGAERLATIVAPPMTEGIASYRGDLLVLFESAASPYRLGSPRSRHPVDRLWSLDGERLRDRLGERPEERGPP